MTLDYYIIATIRRLYRYIKRRLLAVLIGAALCFTVCLLWFNGWVEYWWVEVDQKARAETSLKYIGRGIGE